LLAKKDKDEQVLLAEDHAWMESSKASSTSSDDKIAEVSYYTSESKDLDTLSSVRRPKPSDFMWKKKWLSNTVKANLSSVNHSNLNKNVKQYSRKDLMLCNNSHLRNTRSAHACNNARNALCNAIMNDSVDVNDLFVLMM
nr:hypothetical protein [Tanacetum cinerariifolium]